MLVPSSSSDEESLLLEQYLDTCIAAVYGVTVFPKMLPGPIRKGLHWQVLERIPFEGIGSLERMRAHRWLIKRCDTNNH